MSPSRLRPDLVALERSRGVRGLRSAVLHFLALFAFSAGLLAAAGVLGPAAAKTVASSEAEAALPAWPHATPELEGRFERAQTQRYLVEHRPGLEGFARAIRDRVEAHHDRIYGELGVGDGAEWTRITLVKDADELVALASARHDGRRPPEWADGLAYPRTREIYLHIGRGPDELDRTLQHEISHVAMGVVVGDGRVPTWFSEGVAIRQSEGPALERAWKLTEAATVGRLLDLTDLDRGFPVNGARAGVAYAQAVHFVGFLQAEFGEARFQALVATLGEGAPFADAVAQTFGEPLDSIEKRWRRSLEVWWGWIPLIFGSTALWGVAGVILVGAWRRRRRQRIAQLSVMAAEEAVDMAEDIEIAHNLRPPPNLHDPYDGRPPTLH